MIWYDCDLKDSMSSREGYVCKSELEGEATASVVVAAVVCQPMPHKQVPVVFCSFANSS